MSHQETIAAIATPPGQGGVGIVRISGPKSLSIAEKILGFTPKPRYAHYTDFHDENNRAIDSGIALYFKAPFSFTGEDILELQGHGGPMVLDLLLARALSLGATAARAGEFSERAFLNDKIDLAQAEAIADLIAADSHEAARAAAHSLAGDFSADVHMLVELITQLRIHIESALDFPEEEIDFLEDKSIIEKLKAVRKKLQQVKASAQQGRILKEGMTVVIAGKPNAGKSSLLNRLAGQESAIVSDLPGTTRDILREHIQIEGLPLHIIDTAGLRESDDVVEKEGIRRAIDVIKKADHLLYLVSVENKFEDGELLKEIPKETSITIVHNKIDLKKAQPEIRKNKNKTEIYLSAKTGEGINLLRQHLQECMGYENKTEGKYIARRRHLEAIELAEKHLTAAHMTLQEIKAGELAAEELSLAQKALSSITGAFTNEDLLGRIFSDFCIGK